MDRYWVGGTGTWDSSSTTHWSTSTGGSSGASAPTSADNVIFDSLSNATAYTVTLSSVALCADCTVNGPLAGKVTFGGSATFNIYGSFSLTGGTAGITWSFVGTMNFQATTTGKTIDPNGLDMAGQVAFGGVGGGWTLQNNFSNAPNAKNVTLSNGILDLNGKSVATTTFTISGASTRTLTCGASAISCVTWDATTTTGLTFNVNTSTITMSGATTFTGGGLTYNTVVLTGTTPTIASANTFGTLTRTGTAVKTDTLTLSANQTITGTLTINGNSSINSLLIKSDTAGTARTLTAANVSMTNVDLQDITGAGAGSWDLSAITGGSGDCGGNSGITFTTPVTTNWQSGTTWSTATWSSRVPLPQDTATFTTAGTVTITQDMTRIGSIDFTGSSNKTFDTSTVCTIYGSINLTDLTTLSGSAAYTFGGRGANTINSGGKTWANTLNITLVTGSLTLAADINTTFDRAINVNSGTFSCVNGGNNYAMNIGVLTISSGATITLGSNTHTLLARTGSCIDFSASSIISTNTSTIKFVGALTSDVQFGSISENSLNWNGMSVWNATTNAFSLLIRGAQTFNDFKINPGRTTKFTAGTTTTVTTFTSLGTAGNLCTIGSITAANHTLAKAGGGTITADYMSISRSTATPTLTWLATNSTDGGNNSGWYFGAFPVANPNFFLFFS